jgi:YegS/Rv2252/BmrU family lipid kinase
MLSGPGPGARIALQADLMPSSEGPAEVSTLQNSAPDQDTAPQPRRILAVVNPIAGPRGVPRNPKDLLDRAEKLGVVLQVLETQPGMECETLIATREGSFDCLLAVGGDGTVIEVAQAAMKRGIPLAILPRGTANAVAWHFGLPFDLPRALKVAAQGKPVQIDLAEVQGRKFILMAGLGYDAHVIRDATRRLKERFGFLAYMYSALSNMRRRHYSFVITLDDGQVKRARGAMALVANIGTLAGNIRFVREVSPDDGKLDLVIIAPANFRDFYRMAFRGLFGRLQDDPRVRYYQAASIRIESTPFAPLEIDGTVVEGRYRELEVRALPKALTIMLPPEGMWKVPWMPDVSLPRMPELPKLPEFPKLTKGDTKE